MPYHRADPSQGIDPPRAQNVRSMLRPIVPILSLPFETLMEIFRLYEEDAQKTATMNQTDFELGGVLEIPSESTCHWIPLMLVCRAWRAVGISTPVLWTGIEVFNHVEWLELALVRSRRRPVTLRFRHLSAALEAVRLLLPHKHRIRKLVLPSLQSEYAGDDMQTFLPLLQSHMPLLTELTFMTSAHLQILIDREKEEWPFVPFDSSPARLPALRILRLPCSLVPWMPSALSRLRSLHLSACEADQAQGKLSHKDFLRVLEACQELENLVLLDSFVSSATLGGPPSASDPDWAHPCTLLQLRSLRVDDDAVVISWLLSSLRLPEDAKIHVVGCASEFDALPEAAFTALLPTRADGTPYVPLAQPTSATIHVIEHHCEISLWDGARRARLQLGLHVRWRLSSGWDSYIQEAMDEFSDMLRGAPVADLALFGTWEHAGDPVLWAAFLSCFPQLEELELIGPGSPAVLFHALQMEDTSGEGLLCPELKGVLVDFAWWEDGLMELILDTLRMRESRGMAPLECIYLGLDSNDPGDWFDENVAVHDNQLRALVQDAECRRWTEDWGSLS